MNWIEPGRQKQIIYFIHPQSLIFLIYSENAIVKNAIVKKLLKKPWYKPSFVIYIFWKDCYHGFLYNGGFYDDVFWDQLFFFYSKRKCSISKTSVKTLSLNYTN